jgi:hemerythrin-like metal-binding protein
MHKKFIWTEEEYGVGVEEFDEQHQVFFDVCNQLFALAESEAPSKEEMLAKIGELESYSNYHLYAEEELFAKTKYDGAIEHIQEHDEFRIRIREFMERAKVPDADVKKIIDEFADYAGEWLLGHILVLDKAYTKFFNEHGIK